MCRGVVTAEVSIGKALPSFYEYIFIANDPEVEELIQNCDYFRRGNSHGTKFYKVTERDGDVLVKVLEQNGYTVQLKDERVSRKYKKAPVAKTAMLSHQKKSLSFSRKYRDFVLADEMGLGKTFQSLSIALDKKANCGCKHCLIVCCMSSTVLNWEREVYKHTDCDCIVLGKSLVKGGITASKLYDVKRKPDEYFWIVNVEALRDKDIANTLAGYTRDGEIGMVIVDEIHLCKTPDSAQAKGILGLQSEFKLALSGTPVVKNPLTMYMPLKWMECISQTYTDFCNYYVEYAPFGARIPRGYKHVWELRRMLESVMLRRKKDEVLDLPEKTREVVHLAPTPEQKSAYAEAMSECDMDKYRNDWAREHLNILQGYLKLRQAASDVALYNDKLPSSSSKLDWAVDKVTELVGDGRNVVVFSCFRHMVTAFSERIQTISHGIITGDTPQKVRDSVVSEFGTKTHCLIGTVQAAGVGLNMVVATTVIFLDLPWDRATLEQAEDRIHRIGSTQKITSYLLLTSGTIDEDMFELLQKKGRFADSMLSE